MIQDGDGNLYSTTTQGGANGAGTVFKLTPAGMLTTLHSFHSGVDGDGTAAGLVKGRDGNFYGLTLNDGPNDGNAFFKITPTGALTVLHGLTSVEGTEFFGTLVLGSDGDFYGATTESSPNQTGTVFKVTPDGALAILHAFSATNNEGENGDGAVPWSGVIQADDGDFYGTTRSGGAGGQGTIYQMTPAGVLVTLHDFSGGDGSDPLAGLLQGLDGNFYGTTRAGGSNGTGTIFKVTPAGSLTALYSFSVTGDNGLNNDGAHPSAGLIQGSDGSLYGTTYDGGQSGTGTIFRLDLPPDTASPYVTSSATASATVGEAFSYQITATDYPTSYGVVGLIAGVAIDSKTGLISGTPTGSGMYMLSLRAANDYGTGTATLTLTVASAPTVTIIALGDAEAMEGGENGKVAIRRDGDLTNPLTVRYKVAGGVMAGVDYKALPGTVTIPAGATQAKVKLKAIDDYAHEGTRVAKIKLKAASDGSYVLGTPVAAKVKIIDND